MSLYADYLKERTEDCIIEGSHGFATYRFLNDKQCYIVDIFVVQEYRQMRLACELADIITSIAKEKGCTELLGTVCVNTKNSDISLKVLQGYGMTLKSAQNDVIVMKKDI